jgi:hypothetical protein
VQNERSSSVKGRPFLAIEYSNSSEIFISCKTKQVKSFKLTNELVKFKEENDETLKLFLKKSITNRT